METLVPVVSAEAGRLLREVQVLPAAVHRLAAEAAAAVVVAASAALAAVVPLVVAVAVVAVAAGNFNLQLSIFN